MPSRRQYLVPSEIPSDASGLELSLEFGFGNLGSIDRATVDLEAVASERLQAE